MEKEPGYYHLLVGTVSSVVDGSRAYNRLYGYSMLTPGALTVGAIEDASGNMRIDLETGQILVKHLRIGPPDASKDLASELGELLGLTREAVVWEVEPVSLRPGTPLYIDSHATDERLHQLQLTVRYLRAGRDVSPVMARSSERLYTWERHSPLGRDDRGVTDEQWTADNSHRDIITLTPDDVMWVANVTTHYDPDRLEEEYQRLTK